MCPKKVQRQTLGVLLCADLGGHTALRRPRRDPERCVDAHPTTGDVACLQPLHEPRSDCHGPRVPLWVHVNVAKDMLCDGAKALDTGDLVMLHQKTAPKLHPRWRGPFRIHGLGGTHQISYTLRQLNGQRIRGAFHRDDLKPFEERPSHLCYGDEPTLPISQTIRRSRRPFRTFVPSQPAPLPL